MFGLPLEVPPTLPVDVPLEVPLGGGLALSVALLPVGLLRPPLLPFIPPTSLVLFVVEPVELPRLGDSVVEPLWVPLVDPPLLVSRGWPTYVLPGVPVLFCAMVDDPTEPDPVDPVGPTSLFVPLESIEPLGGVVELRSFESLLVLSIIPSFELSFVVEELDELGSVLELLGVLVLGVVVLGVVVLGVP
jgi:hypothetical protein